MKKDKDHSQHGDEGRSSKRWVRCGVEVDYFGEERKVGKAERKMAKARDRSQYKKTDQRKEAKQLKEIPQGENLKRGRVLSIASQGIMVEHEGETLCCTLRGALKKEKTLMKNLVVVGDFVLFESTSPAEGMIVHVEPRHSVLSRAENLSRRKEQLIAANIDQVIITISVVSPPLKPPLIDRYIIAAEKGGMKPLIVINKVDLFALEEGDEEFLEKEKELYEYVLKAYKAADIPVISVSVVSGEGIDLLKQAMTGKASVFSGQSGVGKSSLINAVTDYELKIGDIVERTQKGAHTTTTAQLLPLDFGGWCIDTPGIKSFGLWDLDKDEIEAYFPEIFECGHRCRFPDCTHMLEEGCAVKEAVEKEEISHLRYESYASLIMSLSSDHLRR